MRVCCTNLLFKNISIHFHSKKFKHIHTYTLSMALHSPGKPSTNSYTPPCSPFHSPTEQPASSKASRWPPSLDTTSSGKLPSPTGLEPCLPGIKPPALPLSPSWLRPPPRQGPCPGLSRILRAEEAAGKDCGLSEQQPPGPRLQQDRLPPQHGQIGPGTGILGPAISVLMTLSKSLTLNFPNESTPWTGGFQEDTAERRGEWCLITATQRSWRNAGMGQEEDSNSSSPEPSVLSTGQTI